jgi:hypothetical protein
MNSTSENTAIDHLFLPDLVEARIAELALQPGFARSEAAFAYTACPQNF